MKKDTRFELRLTNNEKELLFSKAESHGLSASNYLISLLKDDVPVSANTQEALACNVLNTVMNILQKHPSVSKKIQKEIQEALNEYAKY